MAFKTVGKALWVTTVTLVAGFSVLSFSGFKPNSNMGIMTGIIISFALMLDFLLLPTILLKVEEKIHKKTDTDHLHFMLDEPAVDNQCADACTNGPRYRR